MSWIRLRDNFRQLSVERKTISILLDNIDLKNQLEKKQTQISLELPLISLHDEEGYNLRALVYKALKIYDLDFKCGLQVDYWSNSMQIYVLCDDIFNHDSDKPYLISKDDLVYYESEENDEEAPGKTCLILRIENCTGNVIILEEK